MSAPDALQAVEAALARIDHTSANATLITLRAELDSVTGRIAETQGETNRLAGDIRDYTGPEPGAVAARILAGAELADAVYASPSLAELQERRAALQAALPLLTARADELRHEITLAEGEALRPIGAALRPYVAALHERQRQAAEVIVEADAALHAVARGLRVHVEHLTESERATDGLEGAESLLGWRDSLQVREPLLRALRPLVDASEAVHGLPSVISLR